MPYSSRRARIVTLGLWGMIVFGCAGANRGIAPEDLPAPQHATQVSVGSSFSCALLDNGGVRCWGKGFDGTDRDRPPTDIDIGAKVTHVSAGNTHACALTETGGIRCWGRGTWGALGYVGRTRVQTPAELGDVAIGGKAIAVHAGSSSTCAILEGGALRCWGTAQGGRLGYGNDDDIGDDDTPASAGNVNVGSPVTNIAMGITHTCSILQDGSVRCWGQNKQGELGRHLGTGETVRGVPAAAPVVDVGGAVQALAAGNSHTCALLEGGRIRCWGFGAQGRLGYGNETNVGTEQPPSAAGDVQLPAPAVQLATGADHTCALLSGGTVRCWGANESGQLGYGSREPVASQRTPTALDDVNVGGKVIQIAAGGQRTCALLEGGTVRCWGQGSGSPGGGTLGYGVSGNVGDNETPAKMGDVVLLSSRRR